MNSVSPRQISMRRERQFLAIWVTVLSIATTLTLLPAQGTLANQRHTFESPQTTWQLVDSDCQARLVDQHRTLRQKHGGHASEFLQVAAQRGTFAHLIHAVDAARVIPELAPSLWVLADRPGVQMLARIVLPRSLDQRSGKPVTVLVQGETYDRPGTWQQLSIPNIEVELERQIRILRARLDPQIDGREAYLDLVVLNAYTQPGVLNLWTDDLEIAGHIGTGSHGDLGVVAHPVNATLNNEAAGAHLQGSVLLAGGRPEFVKAIQHNGEPFEFLKSLGFNTVYLADPPSERELAEAARHGIWIIAPPPLGVITAAHESVLAWNLGEQLAGADLPRVRDFADRLRQSDPLQRPILGVVEQSSWNYSRTLDVLLLDRTVLQTSFELSRYTEWLRFRQRAMRPGTPVWAAIQSEPSAALVEQLYAFGVPGSEVSQVEPDQIRLLVYRAIAAGSRGLVFHSHSRLDANDGTTRLRAKTLELINGELRLLEPWLAGASVVQSFEIAGEDIDGYVLETERAKLVLLIRALPGQQFVTSSPRSKKASFISVAGDGAYTYQITSAGLKTLRHERVAGGIEVVLDEAGLATAVVLTQNPLVVHYLTKESSQSKHRSAQLRQELATEWLSVVAGVDQQLSQARPSPKANDWIRLARATLARSERLLSTGDYGSTEDFASRAAEFLTRAQQIHFQNASQSFPSSVSSPLCLRLATLPVHWQTIRNLSAAQWSNNLLPAGGFEKMEHLLQSGWRRFESNETVVQSQVELTVEQAVSGSSCLHLSRWLPAGQKMPGEPASLTISSGPVNVRAGQLVRIHGWVRCDAAVTDHPDGLMIMDSITGVDLAHRVSKTQGWQEFSLYRIATRQEPLTVSISLAGLGEVFLDELTVHLTDSLSLAAAVSQAGNLK